MKRKYIKVLTGLLAFALLVSGVAADTERENPARRDMRAVWVATIYNLDYPRNGTTSPDQLKREADAILQGSAEMGMNTVILQVRPSCDAIYPTKLFPWSKYLSGTVGTAPNAGFDPLAYWVTKAHALGLELHAWINPFRVTKGGKEEFGALTVSSPAVQHPEWVVNYKENYYLNPGLPEVQELVIQGAEELARNYDLDGIHMDDYFYPGADFGDAAAYAQYGRGFSSLSDWRRDNVNKLVRVMGERLSAIKPKLIYGISPAGVWANQTTRKEGSPTRGYETYTSAYADTRKWVQEGWVDYICPQIYWQIGHEKTDYKALVNWWADTVRETDVRLYIGMADYMAGAKTPTSPWYGTTAIEQQLALNRTIPAVTGEVHFRYLLMVENPAIVALYKAQYGKTVPPAVTPTLHPTPHVTPSPSPSPSPSSPVPGGDAGNAAPSLNVTEHGAYIQGSGGLFQPDASLSRAEAVALLARLTVDAGGAPLYTGAAYTGGFGDVAANAWYAPYVAFAARYGIVNGYADGTFRPERNVTRGELVKLIANYFDVAGTSEQFFSDVPTDYWAAPAIAYAVHQGWVIGGGAFRPAQPATRAEAVQLLNSALRRSPDKNFIDSTPDLNTFADVTSAHWAYYDILEAAYAHSYDRNLDGVEAWRTH